MRQEKNRLVKELSTPVEIPVSIKFIDIAIVQGAPY